MQGEEDCLTYIIRSTNSSGFQGVGYVNGVTLTIVSTSMGILRLGDTISMAGVATSTTVTAIGTYTTTTGAGTMTVSNNTVTANVTGTITTSRVLNVTSMSTGTTLAAGTALTGIATLPDGSVIAPLNSAIATIANCSTESTNTNILVIGSAPTGTISNTHFLTNETSTLAAATKIVSSTSATVSFQAIITGTSMAIASVPTGFIGLNSGISGTGIPVGTYITALNASSYTLNQGQMTSSFTATIDTTTLTVTAITTAISIGQTITGVGVSAKTVITGQLTGTIGDVGTYTVSQSQTVATGIAMTGAYAAGAIGSFTATTNSAFSATITTTQLTVTILTSGVLAIGQTIAGVGVTAGTLITAFVSGTQGGVGVYTISPSQTVASTVAMTGAYGTGGAGSYYINNANTIATTTLLLTVATDPAVYPFSRPLEILTGVYSGSTSNADANDALVFDQSTTTVTIAGYNGAALIYNGTVSTQVDGAAFIGGWIQEIYPVKVIAVSYWFQPTGQMNCTPINWIFAGSNDGTNFITLDTRAAQSPVLNQINTYTPTAYITPYLYYRIIMTKTGGIPTLQLREFGITAAKPAYYGVTTAPTAAVPSSTIFLKQGINNIETNDCNIKLSALQSRYTKFQCEVVSFMVSAKTTDVTANIIELRQDGMPLLNGIDNLGGGLKTIAFTTMNTCVPQSTYTFLSSNFGNKLVRFQLYDEFGALLLNSTGGNFAKPWVLVLKIKPTD